MERGMQLKRPLRKQPSQKISIDKKKRDPERANRRLIPFGCNHQEAGENDDPVGNEKFKKAEMRKAVPSQVRRQNRLQRASQTGKIKKFKQVEVFRQ